MIAAVLAGIAPRSGHTQGPPRETFSERHLRVVEPERGIDQVPLPDKVPWCTAPYTGEQWDGGRLGRTLTNRGSDDFPKALMQLCMHPTDRANRLAVQYVLQSVMNENQISQAEAEAFLAKKLGLAAMPQVGHGAVSAGDEARFNFTENDYTPIKPDPNVDTAKLTGAPSWCAGVKVTERWDPSRIGRTVNNKYGIDGTIDSALQICERPNNPTWQKEAAFILQKWMNAGAFTQPEAEASLKARVQKAKFAADKAALCKALEPSPEAGGEVLAFAEAHEAFFGCKSDKLPMWVDRSVGKSTVAFYIDAAPRPETEMLRMYFLLHFVPSPWTDHELPSRNTDENRQLLYYAIAQGDFAALDPGVLDKQLSAAPFNDYARTIAHEAFALLRSERAVYEAAVDKLAKDKDYAHVLREIPRSGAAGWEKLTAQWKAELDRSYQFERKLSEPSRSALKGCSKELKPDAEKLIRSYKEKTYAGLVTKIAGDPVAALLLSRLAICDAIDGAYGISGALASLVQHGRELRGPRTAIYYDMLEALVAAHKDRPKFLLPEQFLFALAADSSPSLYELYGGLLTGDAPAEPDKLMERGVVKSATKVADGIKIVFKTDRISFPHYDCTDDTRHPLKINPATGHIEYYRNCVATGKMDSQDNTPFPITVSEASAELVKPGVVVTCGEVQSLSKGNAELHGFVVYVKKSAKETKIDTFYGFTL